MYCRYCGKQIDDKAIFCPHCGIATEEKSASKTQEPTPKPAPMPVANVPPTLGKTNILTYIGFLLAFIVPLAGIICSIIGLCQLNRTKEKGKAFAIAGIIISVLMSVFQGWYFWTLIFQ